MPCEIWVKGYRQISGCDRFSPSAGTYTERLVSSPSTLPAITGQPIRANPAITNASFDSYNHHPSVANGGLADCWRVSPPPTYFLKGSCPPNLLPTALDPAQQHDCINGSCLPATVYKTPGVYPNLASCQGGCAKNSVCTGECVPSSEIQNLNTAVATLKSKACK